MILDYLNNEEIDHLKNLVLKFKNRFLLEGQYLGAANTVMHRIITTDDIPVNIKQYKFPISLTEEVNRQVEKLLKEGIIKPSSSPYNSPLWLVTSIFQSLRLDYLNNEEKDHLKNLVLKFKNRFLLEGQHLGAANTVMHRIITTDDIPVNIKQYKFPISLTEEVNRHRQMEKLLKEGIIKPSSSPYNSSLWLVTKKMDVLLKPKWRLVSDFSVLNENTITDAYPLPDITQIIDQVGGHKYYTVLDLASGFHQILMDPRDVHKTAFSTPYGHYEYARMTLGLKNAPPTFQRYIDETFKGLQGKILFTFIDDIIIFADKFEKLTLIMERLEKANLQLNINKCEFLKLKSVI